MGPVIVNSELGLDIDLIMVSKLMDWGLVCKLSNINQNVLCGSKAIKAGTFLDWLILRGDWGCLWRC